jgi:peptidoglycan/xylan/chitin deacetylase (PgdA/CDA1 family)
MILMYHKVDLITPTIWWVSPWDLKRHLTQLRHKDFVYLEDYNFPDTQVVITFDDAYENVHRHALPVLSTYGVPFEVFVIGDRIGEWNDFDAGEPLTRHMGMQHLHDIARHGGRIQWHSRSHPNLTKLDDSSIAVELSVPAELRQEFPEPHLTWFCYPEGAHDDRAVDLARKMFRGAVSVTHGRFDDRWQLNRINVDRHTAITPHDMKPLLKQAGISWEL